VHGLAIGGHPRVLGLSPLPQGGRETAEQGTSTAMTPATSARCRRANLLS
jgi:hypothetical protein